MRTTQKKIWITTTILLLLLIGCSQEKSNFKLEQSVFIEDNQAPGLPIYSEWGYNTFGAYIDREVFRSNRTTSPIKVISKKDTLSVTINGVIASISQEQNINEIPLSMTLSWAKEKHYLSHTELLQFDNQKIDLSAENLKITVLKNGEKQPFSILGGEITIQKARKLIVDKRWLRTIVSGTFNLKATLNKQPISIRSGRFDFGIGYENFFYLK